MLSLEWQQGLANADLIHYRRISSVHVFGRDQAGSNPSSANLLKNHCSRRAVPGEMPSGLFRSQPFRETSPRLLDHSLAALGCGGVMKPHLTIPTLARNLGWQ